MEGGWVVDEENPSESYESTLFSQKCTGAHFFTDEDPTLPMDIKLRQFYKVNTGYKIWDSTDDR